MPHATQSYDFESYVLRVAQGRCGERAGTIPLGPAGEVLDVLRGGVADHVAVRGQLKAQGAAFVFYDPFDAPEYIWLEWHRVSRTAMEGFVGAAFEEADFVPWRQDASRLDPPGSFPETWGVMF